MFFQYALITGLQMYTKYETCDPFKGGIVKSADQVGNLKMFAAIQAFFCND